MEKQTKTDYVGSIYTSDLDGLNLKEIINLLKEQMPENTILDYDYSDSYFNVIQPRLETDEEFSKRIRDEARQKERTEIAEKAKLAELLAKYGDK